MAKDVHMRKEKTQPRQAAVIPVRRVAGRTVQVCLIRRKNSARWGIPKGYIEHGDDWREAALGEAQEEAGLDGRLLDEIIGTYEYPKGPLTLTVLVCVMEVLEERTTWHEMRWRERRWYSIEEAGALLKGHRVWPLYDRIRSSLAAMSPNAQLAADAGQNRRRG
jgi:8-oxo-dGTP pyrophosphatase MutT (NUDIX family)